MTTSTYHRLAWGLALASMLFLVWAIGALGIIGDGSRHDRMYLGVIAVFVVGAALARLRPRGMAVTLLATALAQAMVGAVALVAGYHDVPGASALEIVGLTAMYVVLFALSAWLFRQAAGAAHASRATVSA
jgi:hypothetical protein